VNADLGEIGQRIRQFGELDPVELDVLPGGEVAIAAIVAPRDMRQRPQLLRRQRSVGESPPGTYRRAIADKRRSAAAAS